MIHYDLIQMALCIAVAAIACTAHRRGVRKGLSRAKELAHQEANHCRNLQEAAKAAGYLNIAAKMDARATSMRCFARLMDSEMASRFMTTKEEG